MCLNIDGQQFCSILINAPHFQGKSLERIEHELEEGQWPYTPEIEELLAKTCELSVETYRSRLTRIRGENVVKEIAGCGNRGVLHTRYRSCGYFELPQSCTDYIAGRIHTVPILEYIPADSQKALAEFLVEKRRFTFLTRLDEGITWQKIRDYPEWKNWLLPELYRELHGEHCPKQKKRTRMAIRLMNGDMPFEDIFLSNERRAELARIYCEWFDSKSWFDLPALINVILEPDDLARAQALFSEKRLISARKPRRGQISKSRKASWRQMKREINHRIKSWRKSIAPKYLPRIGTFFEQFGRDAETDAFAS